MTCLSEHIVSEFTDDEVELSHFAKQVGIGRTTMFTILKAAGWIQPYKPLPEEWTLREGLLSLSEKRCSTPQFSRVKFHTTSLTKKGCVEIMTTLPQLVARISNEDLKSKTALKLYRAGFVSVLR